MPEPRGKSAPPARAVQKSLAPLRVTYYRRMHLQRVYSVLATWDPKSPIRPPAGVEPVTLRVVIAGAQVVPSEHTLDPAKPDAKAVFHVTPLAKGKLRTGRLEVIMEGRKVQEIPLPAKVVNQRLTLVFLFLAVAVPWFLLHYFKYSPLQDISTTPLANFQGVPPKKTAPPGVKPATIPNSRPPAETLERRLRENLPELPPFVKDVSSDADAELKKVPKTLGQFYEDMIVLTDRFNLPFYTAVAFLFLSFVSFVFHNDKRKRRVGQPIPLARLDGAVATGAGKRGEAFAVED